MRIALNKLDRRATSVPLRLMAERERPLYANHRDQLRLLYRKINDRSRSYVSPRPYIHYADRFSKSKR